MGNRARLFIAIVLGCVSLILAVQLLSAIPKGVSHDSALHRCTISSKTNATIPEFITALCNHDLATGSIDIDEATYAMSGDELRQMVAIRTVTCQESPYVFAGRHLELDEGDLAFFSLMCDPDFAHRVVAATPGLSPTERRAKDALIDRLQNYRA